jgi:restriction system protein
VTRKAWLIRPRPNSINRLAEFRQRSFVACGWPGIGDLTGKREDDIRRLLEETYPNEVSSALATLKIFVYRMNVRDYVVVPDGSTVHFAEITSGYIYANNEDGGSDDYPHRRNVHWFDIVRDREELPEELRRSLRVVRTTAELTPHVPLIDRILGSTGSMNSGCSGSVPNIGVLNSWKQLRDQALQVLERDLQSDDPHVRLKAAEIVLSLAQRDT